MELKNKKGCTHITAMGRPGLSAARLQPTTKFERSEKLTHTFF